MKKILSLLLALALIFMFVGCGKNDTASDTDSTPTVEAMAFVKPEGCVNVLQLSINPQFNLYLDENGKVLAVEAANDDAKSFNESIIFEDQGYETVIQNIITEANDKGFIKDNAEVTIEIIESDNENADEILSNAAVAVNKAATELNIKIAVTTENKTASQTSSETVENVSDGSNSSKTNSTNDTKTAHTHSYSEATCTSASKCSCGATKGTALGHKWSEATCNAPKTCSVCKATEGNIGDHKYSNGYCVYCNKLETINPKTGLKINTPYYEVSFDESSDDYYLTVWQFDGTSIFDAVGVYSTNDEWREYGDIIAYKGKTYYPVGYGGPLPEYTLTDEEIILKFTDEFPEYDDEYRLVVTSSYDLIVTYANGAMFDKDTVLELND